MKKRRMIRRNPAKATPVAISGNKPQGAGKSAKVAVRSNLVAKRPRPEADQTPPNQPCSQTYRDMQTRKRESERKISKQSRTLPPCPEPENWQLRDDCDQSLEAYCRTYRPNTFCLEFSADHREVIRDLEAVITDGGQKAYAMPRGSGKSALLEAACEWAVLYGKRRFPFIVTAAESLAVDILDNIRTTFESNELVAKDFPEICAAIVALDGEARRCKGQLDSTGKHTGIRWMADSLVLPVVSIAHWQRKPPATGMGATLKVSGVTGRIRGTKRKNSDDTYQRPDLVLIDDPQSDQVADSQEQISKLEKLIHGAVLGLAGPKKKIAALCACTIIKPKDLSARMLDRKRHPEWAGTCHSLVYDWPTNKELWKTYLELRKTDQRNNDKTYQQSNEFYLANRVEMDKGSRVGWAERFRDGEHSAIQCAYNLLCDVGEEAFMAEYQNQPIETKQIVVKLSPDDVVSRITKTVAGDVPIDAQVVTGFIDVNDHALAWVMGAFKKDANKEVTGTIIGYGEWGMNGNGVEIGQTDRVDRIWDEKWNALDPRAREGKKSRFWKAMDGLGNWLLQPRWLRQGKPVFVDMILIDSGYTLDAGTRFTHDWCRSAHERMGSNSVFMPDRGWWAKSFRIKSDNNASVLQQSSEHWWRMEQVEIAPGVKINAVAHDADWHRKKMQEAWLASPGSPGSLSVYSASQVMHTRFAEQVACEKLTWYGENDNPRISGRYEWDKTVGIKNEMGDCCVGVRLAAMVKLVGATSIIAQPAGGNIGSASASRQSSQPAPVQAGGAPRSRRAIVPLKW